MSTCPLNRKKSKGPPPLIIPAWLDDARLRPSVFRVYCRIARRAGKKDGTGKCFERLEKIAEGCQLRRATVQKALRELIELELIEAEPQPGRPTIYRIASDPPQKINYRENE